MRRKPAWLFPSRIGLLLRICCLALLLIACWPQPSLITPSSPTAISTTQPVIQPTLPIETPTAISPTQPIVQATLPVQTPTSTFSNEVVIQANLAVQTETPVAESSLPLPDRFTGVEANLVLPQMIDQLNEIGVRFVRRNGLLWSQVESVEGERNWGSMAKLEEGLQFLGSYGFQTILIVRSTPGWAQKVEGYSCGAINRKYFTAFANFLRDAVARYSVQPFNVKYWEIWNEPDVDPSLVSPESVFGCWGDQTDEYYGGRYYAQMLKVAYSAIKEADPQARVLAGGLLLDCDPTHPPVGKDCNLSRFLEGILQGGGANSFDIASFHGYAYYDGTMGMDERNPAWVDRGGSVLGKANFVREVLAAFGVEKPIFDTESALLCPEWAIDLCNPPGDQFYEAQADYAVILYTRNRAEGISGTIWYSFDGPGWRYSGLLDETGTPKPAYQAMKFLNQELGEAQYAGPVNDYPFLRGFSFATLQKRIWVLWSPDPQAYTIPLPEGVQGVFDKYGNTFPIQDNALEVRSPVYIELSP